MAETLALPGLEDDATASIVPIVSFPDRREGGPASLALER
jgi:hypothetical protein